MIWNKEAECQPREEREKLQSERLRETVRRCYEHVPAYRKKLDEAGIRPSDIRSIADLKYLPFTTAEDLRDNYPFGMFACPLSEVVRVHSSSGTTGKPKVVGYTRNDVETWAEVMARTLACGGAGPHDIIQNAYGYGMFTGGLGIHYGAERMGATVVPISGGNTKRQVMILEDFGSTMLACTPSYALVIADTAAEMGVDLHKLPLKYGVFGAEPWTDEMRREIEARLGIRATDIYGLSEVIGPGVASACEAQNGLHIFDDHFVPEVIDPNTLEVLPPGTQGELVFTSLTKEAFPILRYRTRDITRLSYEPCACGRTHPRMQRVAGRTDDMLIIRGVNVFPSQIESALMGIEGTEPHYVIVVDRSQGRLDELEVWVEVSPELISGEVRRLELFERKVTAELTSVLGLSLKVRLVEPKTIARSEGKARRIIDRRELGS
ncbi:MAG TPA: phenylacetate--CoA ligase [Armatimonadota bacterium]|jgi:phenylacetate-CoA ligase|nr:phenylacetate--CoA ligase [Armatimonadota bacterium]HOJ20831.1 phenylacetate--CoA ligase [Armatimonadota bacterium]HOM82605.1 phenylacetate--CoA ligase [Armatimonadota bacterium]HOQ29300.1 phenylacetate--CoA ligase [Armatimonadota bacterium]HPO72986.1 phenylacetate--CoA ligase [Armatimonadota bacterium]